MEAADVIQRVSNRIRGDAYSSDELLTLVSKTQQVINAATQDVILSGVLTTVPYMQVYDLRAVLPQQVRVLSVQEGQRDLDRLRDWRELSYRNRAWFRQVGPRFESYVMMGRDILLLHPAKDVASSVTVVYTELTSALTHITDVISVGDDIVPTVLDLTEALLLLKARRLESIPAVIQRVAQATGVPLREQS